MKDAWQLPRGLKLRKALWKMDPHRKSTDTVFETVKENYNE